MALKNIIYGKPLLFRKWLVWCRHLGLQKTDMFIASYPKSGNTWLRFILASIITGRESDFDTVANIIPEVERHRSGCYFLPGGKRLIKTHEQWRPAYKKSVYIIRDGRDVAVSYYFHQQRLALFKGDFSKFLKLFVIGKLDGYGGWIKNVESWQHQYNRTPQSVLLIKYEDMLEHTFDVVWRVVNFLKIETYNDKISWAIDRNSAPHMLNKEYQSTLLSHNTNKSNIAFIRKASWGQWKQFFKQKDIELFNEKAGRLNYKLGYRT